MLAVLRVSKPLVGHANPARERDPAVDDEDLAMGAEIQILGRVEASRIERQHAGAGIRQSIDVRSVHRAGADGVDERDPDAAARRPFERAGEAIGDLA